VKKLLATVNGASPVQIRSRCAILLCAVYGLRVGEVCRLRLDDIDWADEKISVRRSKDVLGFTIHMIPDPVGFSTSRATAQSWPGNAQMQFPHANSVTTPTSHTCKSTKSTRSMHPFSLLALRSARRFEMRLGA
jgi:integrase